MTTIEILDALGELLDLERRAPDSEVLVQDGFLSYDVARLLYLLWEREFRLRRLELEGAIRREAAECLT